MRGGKGGNGFRRKKGESQFGEIPRPQFGAISFARGKVGLVDAIPVTNYEKF